MLAAALSLGLAAGPVGAYHTWGELECDSGDSYSVDAASIQPFVRSPKFDTPAPWSGLILLDGTERVFHAFTIVTKTWSISTEATDRNPHAVVHCTLYSEGPNFPWELDGFFAN